MSNKIQYMYIILLFFKSCSSISNSSIPPLKKEPKAPILSEVNVKTYHDQLSLYQRKLLNYYFYLTGILWNIKNQVNDSNFPEFTLMNHEFLKKNRLNSLNGIKREINVYRKYIQELKSIVEIVRKRYYGLYNRP